MKTEILQFLRNADGFVSGQELCEHFGVSRTAVWKVINQLKEEGYQIEAVRNKGYRIIDSADILSEEELTSLIAGKTSWAGQNIVYFDETDSTNLQAKRLAENGAPHGTLLVADMQTAGRGRRGRSWNSPHGGSIYMTLLLRPDLIPNKAPMLTLVMALSVVEGIREVTGLNIQIKWPNDIICNGRKLVGILTEMNTEIDYINYVVVGTGINTNIEEFSPESAPFATSLKLELGQTVRRSELIASIMKYFEKDYENFMEHQDLSGLQAAYNSLLVNCDKDVKIISGNDSYVGHALGITPEGELLVRHEDGTIEEVYAGEVSVRGIYGYV